jgi:hypothetical protein
MKKLLQRFPILIACIFAFVLATAGQAAAVGGPIMLSGDDADDSGHCQGTACGGLYAKALKFIVDNSQSGGTGIIAIGVNSSSALSGFNSWNSAANGGPSVAVTHARSTAEIASTDFLNYAAIYIPSDWRNTRGGITPTQITALNARQADIADFINQQGGGLMALSESALSNKYQWLPLPLTDANVSHNSSARYRTTADMNTIVPGITPGNLNHGCCYHTVFTGPAGFSGLKVLAYDDHNNNGTFDGPGVDHVLILGGVQVTIQGSISLSPATALNGTGDFHIVTATAEDGDPLLPAAGVTVTFEVSAGPNAGTSGNCNNGGCTTDANGSVTFSYLGDGGIGTDSIVATFIDANGATQTSNTAEAEWEVRNLPPTADAGTSHTVEQAGPTGSNVMLDGSGSTDPDGDTLTYSWSTGDTGVNPIVLLSAGTHTISLVVNDGTVDSAPDTVQIIVQDTIAPVITVSDRTEEATGPTQSVDVSADAGATDVVGVTSLTNNSPGTFSANTTTVVTWTACDAAGNCSTATQSVEIQDTIAPVITTTVITLEATGANTPVDVTGTASATDIVGVTSFTNNSPGGFAVGTHTVTWTACDAAGNCSTQTQTVSIVDTTPPEISNACLTDKLWPPNHKLVLVSTGSVSDIADPNAMFSISVTSNQPINGSGDGNTDPDWTTDTNGANYEVSLRAERAGNLGQRDYTTTVTATDASGNTSTATCSASVPHDQGNNTSPATKKGKK